MRCCECQTDIYPEEDTYYQTLDQRLSVCEDCIMEEKRPNQPLQRVKAKPKAKLLYTHTHNGHTVYLSNVAFVRDESLLRKHKIIGILSLIEFESASDPLSVIYGDKRVVKYEGRMYYWIKIPDVQDPKQLEEIGEPNVIEKGLSFIEMMQQHNKESRIVIHCRQGQKRSPTLFLSYLMKIGNSLKASIKMLGKGYQDRHYDWRGQYIKTRKEWIKKLMRMDGKWEEKLEKYQGMHQNEMDEIYELMQDAAKRDLFLG